MALIDSSAFFSFPEAICLHDLYIFRKPDPLVTDMKNVVCSRLRAMLYLEIQKGKEAMKKKNSKCSGRY